MTTLTEFLLARIAEDEVSADELHWDACEHNAARETGGFPCDCWYPQRVLARCAADRRVVETCGRIDPREDDYPLADQVLCVLASVYADHPDYREEWRL